MNPDNERWDTNREPRDMILTCRWKVDVVPINVTEVPEFLLRTVEWNVGGTGGPGMATEKSSIYKLKLRPSYFSHLLSLLRTSTSDIFSKTKTGKCKLWSG